MITTSIWRFVFSLGTLNHSSLKIDEQNEEKKPTRHLFLVNIPKWTFSGDILDYPEGLCKYQILYFLQNDYWKNLNLDLNNFSERV